MDSRRFENNDFYKRSVSSYLPSNMMYDMPRSPSWGEKQNTPFQWNSTNNENILNPLSVANQGNSASAKPYQTHQYRQRRNKETLWGPQKYPEPQNVHPENIENFEPGFPASPAWRPSSRAEPIKYPFTPNFKKWLQCSPSPIKRPPVVEKVENNKKLGPERYKSMRVTEAARGTRGRGETIETFFDPGFNNYEKPMFNGRNKEKKQSLYKTELCTNWCLTSICTYGNKCHFAHGIDDLKSRTRLENFKTQPCCDPAREGSRRCLYGSRCNYCHPGEAIRRPVGKLYFDMEYYRELEMEYGENKYPFGIYI